MTVNSWTQHLLAINPNLNLNDEVESSRACLCFHWLSAAPSLFEASWATYSNDAVYIYSIIWNRVRTACFKVQLLAAKWTQLKQCDSYMLKHLKSNFSLFSYDNKTILSETPLCLMRREILVTEFSATKIFFSRRIMTGNLLWSG